MGAPKTPKGRTTKQKILDASVALIKEKGFDNATLNDMCRASGVATGTFYHYFSSTQEVLSEILKIEGREIAAYYEKIKSGPPLQVLEKVLDYQMDYFEKKGKEIVSQIYGIELQSHRGDSYLVKILPLLEIMTGLLDSARKNGSADPSLDPEKGAMLLLSLLLGYSFTWLSWEENRPLKAIAGDHLKLEIRRMQNREPLKDRD